MLATAERKQIRGKTARDRRQNSPIGPLSRRPRDTHQSKAYKAERLVGIIPGAYKDVCAGDEMTHEEVVDAVRQIEQTDWFQGTPTDPDAIVAAADWEVTVLNGENRSRSACAVPGLWELRIGPSFRYIEIVVHEMAHLVAPHSGPSHGRGWVAAYLEGLVAIGLGDRAALLAQSFRRRGVPGAGEPASYKARAKSGCQVDLSHYYNEDLRLQRLADMSRAHLLEFEADTGVSYDKPKKQRKVMHFVDGLRAIEVPQTFFEDCLDCSVFRDLDYKSKRLDSTDAPWKLVRRGRCVKVKVALSNHDLKELYSRAEHYADHPDYETGLRSSAHWTMHAIRKQLGDNWQTVNLKGDA